MGRWDIAEWVGPTTNEGDGDGRPGEAADRATECRGAILHIADGYYLGTIAWQKNPDSDVSSQFVVAGPRDSRWQIPDGKAGQVVDTDVIAWTQRSGNGHWISIECSGFSGDALSVAQIESCARILAKAHQVYGVPLQLATSPSGRGLGHHSMGAESGVDWGHSQCPGPKIIAQKSLILARARQIVNGVTPPPPSKPQNTGGAAGMFRLRDPEGAQFVIYPDSLSPTGFAYQEIKVGVHDWMLQAGGIGTANGGPDLPDMPRHKMANNDWRPGAFGPSATEVRERLIADVAARVRATLPESEGGEGLTAEQIAAAVRTELDRTRQVTTTVVPE